MQDPIWDTPLQSGDRLMVRAIPDFHPAREVDIAGEVKYPGPYVIEEGVTRLRDLIDLAGGLTPKASLLEARLVRQNFETEEEDPEFERIGSIPVADREEEDNQYFIMKSREKKGQMVIDFVRLREGDDTQNILLRPGDRVFIPSRKQTVIVSGAASFPGEMVYEEGATVWDYIDQAGGYGWRASEDVVVIKARTGEKKLAKDVEKIEPGGPDLD